MDDNPFSYPPAPPSPDTVLWDLTATVLKLRSRELRSIRSAGLRNEHLEGIAHTVEYLHGQVAELLAGRGTGAPSGPDANHSENPSSRDSRCLHGTD